MHTVHPHFIDSEVEAWNPVPHCSRWNYSSIPENMRKNSSLPNSLGNKSCSIYIKNKTKQNLQINCISSGFTWPEMFLVNIRANIEKECISWSHSCESVECHRISRSLSTQELEVKTYERHTKFNSNTPNNLIKTKQKYGEELKLSVRRPRANGHIENCLSLMIW